MYIKLYNRILDCSLAENRKLRHFFTDMLLCSDADGNVLMTEEAISRRTGAPLEEVLWGIEELLKPDHKSLTPDHEGRRLSRLDGHGYGWKIVNFEMYRDMKNSAQMRLQTKERVKRWRLKHGMPKRGKPLSGEVAAVKALARGDEGEFNRLSEGAEP